MIPCPCLLPSWRILQKKLFLRLRQYKNASTNHGFQTFAEMQSKSATVNQPRVTWMLIALLGLRLGEISDTVRKHFGEIMSRRWILKHWLNLFGIGSVKWKENNVTLFIVTLLMHWQITSLIIPPLLLAQMPLHLFARKLKSRLYNIYLTMLYTTGPSLWKSCMMLYVDPMILQQDQMKYIISYWSIYLFTSFKKF